MSDSAPTPADFAAPGGWTAPGKEPGTNCNGSSGLVGVGGEEPTREVRRFKWWYKGITREGNTCRFEGDGWAEDFEHASENVERMMREKHPEIKWMQGKEIEGRGDNRGVKFGPTIQMLKTKRAAGARSGERNGAQQIGAVPPIDPKLSDSGAWRGSCENRAKKEATDVKERRARTRRLRTGKAATVTRGAVRCSAWLGVTFIALWA